MRTNEVGLALIKSFESCKLEPYLDIADVCTVGFGHTNGVTMDMGPITQAQADEWLEEDIEDSEKQVNRWIKVELTDNQFSALTSLVFNVGSLPLQKTLGTMLRAGNIKGASQQFLRWNMAAGRVSHGLVRRREAERELFLA